MKLTELLEQDREQLMRSLQSAPTRAEAISAVERTLERMLFAYNDAAQTQRERERAAAMIAALRAALPLVDCAGEPKVWEAKRTKKPLRPLAVILLIAGCVCCLGAGALMLYMGASWLLALLPVVGGALLAFAALAAGNGRFDAPERRIEVPTDWDRVWRTLHAAALVMDQALTDAASEERWEARRKAGEASALSDAETKLMSELLEGLYGGDGEVALEKLGAVRHYLKQREVEIVAYDERHAELFDRMPGAETATLRPALMSGGTLLRRGLATVAQR